MVMSSMHSIFWLDIIVTMYVHEGLFWFHNNCSVDASHVNKSKICENMNSYPLWDLWLLSDLDYETLNARSIWLPMCSSYSRVPYTTSSLLFW